MNPRPLDSRPIVGAETNARRVIAITGATGRQGGMVARQLLGRGWQVRALTRNPRSAAARALRQLGADVVYADLDSSASLDSALAGAYGVFGVTEFWEHGYDIEVRQGKTLVDAAAAAGVRHFVFNSVGAAERTRGLGIAHIESKAEIESYLRRTGLSWTIFRPVTFLENFISPRMRHLICVKGVLVFGFKSDKSFQMVALADVAAFVVKAFEDPAAYLGQALELASDRFTMAEFANCLGAAIGRPVRYRHVGIPAQWLLANYVELTRQTGYFKVGRSLIPQFRWNNHSDIGGWDANLDALRALHPELTKLDAWVRSIDWYAGISLQKAAVSR